MGKYERLRLVKKEIGTLDEDELGVFIWFTLNKRLVFVNRPSMFVLNKVLFVRIV